LCSCDGRSGFLGSSPDADARDVPVVGTRVMRPRRLTGASRMTAIGLIQRVPGAPRPRVTSGLLTPLLGPEVVRCMNSGRLDRAGWFCHAALGLIETRDFV